MHENKKTPLARKLEGYTPSSELASFETFEAKKSKKWRGILFPFITLGLIAAAAFFIYNSQTSMESIYTPRETAADIALKQNQLTENNKIQNETLENISNHSPSSTKNLNPTNKRSMAVQTFKQSRLLDSEDKGSDAIALTPANGKPSNDSTNPTRTLDSKYRPTFLLNSQLLNTISFPQVSNGSEKYQNITVNTKSPKPKFYYPSFSFNIGPHYAKNRLVLDPKASEYIHPDFEKILQQTVHSDLGISAQLTYTKPIYKGFSVYIGLGYSGNKLNGSYAFSLDSVPVYDIDNTIAGFIQLDDNSPLRNIDLGSAAQQYGFVNIPIGITYTYAPSRYSLDVSAGTDFAYLIGAKGNILDALNLAEASKLKDVINPRYLSFNSRIAVYRKVNPLFDIGLSAGYNVQTNSLYDQTHYQIKNTAFDLQAVLKYNLLNK